LGRIREALRRQRLIRGAVVTGRTLLSPRRRDTNGVWFFFYHDMRADERRAFQDQLDAFEQLGEIVSLETAIGLAGKPVDGRYICLTFDDGCRGMFEHGLPILADRSLPAAFFVVSGWIDAGRTNTLSWSDCRTLVRSGMTIGSHTAAHRRLALLSDADVSEELGLSKLRIQAELSVPCVHFACPWGQPTIDFKPNRDVELARAAGYRSFFTTMSRRANDEPSSLLWPRVRMEPGWSGSDLSWAFSR